MLKIGDQAAPFALPRLDGAVWGYATAADHKPTLLVFFETDCPTCRLTLPYLNRLAHTLGAEAIDLIGISQDGEALTRELVKQLDVTFPVVLDHDLSVSRLYDPVAVPTLFLV